MVDQCLRGDGQVGSDGVRRGFWNQNATAEFMSDQHAVNAFLGDLSTPHRELVAGLLRDQYVARSGGQTPASISAARRSVFCVGQLACVVTMTG